MLIKFIIAASIAASSTMAIDMNSAAKSFTQENTKLPDCDGTKNESQGDVCISIEELMKMESPGATESASNPKSLASIRVE